MGIFFSVILGSASNVSSSSCTKRHGKGSKRGLDDRETQLVSGVDDHNDPLDLAIVVLPKVSISALARPAHEPFKLDLQSGIEAIYGT